MIKHMEKENILMLIYQLIKVITKIIKNMAKENNLSVMDNIIKVIGRTDKNMEKLKLNMITLKDKLAKKIGSMANLTEK